MPEYRKPAAGRPRGRQKTTIFLAALGVALGLGLLTGCGLRLGPRPAASPSPSASLPQFSTLEALLRLVPDTSETRRSTYAYDYALASQVLGIMVPGTEAGASALEDYLIQMGTKAGVSGPFISGFDAYAKLALDRRAYLGFDIRDLTGSVLAGLPPRTYELLKGRFTPADAEKALAACSVCPPANREEHRGIPFLSWGEDLAIDAQKRLTPPAFDELGRGGRLAIQDQYVFRTTWTDGLKALIDVEKGAQRSLLDAEEFGGLARGMASLNAYATFFTDSVDSQNATSGQTGEPLMRPFLAFAAGKGKDDKGFYMALAIAHRDADSAAQNVDLLRKRVEQATSLQTKERWNQLIDGLEVGADGRFLLAKLRGSRMQGNLWISWILVRDPLLLHE